MLLNPHSWNISEFTRGSTHCFCVTTNPKLSSQIECSRSCLLETQKHQVVASTFSVAIHRFVARTTSRYLRERFPTPEGHSVSGDLTAMFRYFTEGKTYKMRPLPTPGEGQVELPICTLRMTDEQVLENFETFMVMLHSVKKEHPFQFVTKCVVRSPPSKEEFMLLDSELAPREEEEEEEEADDDQQESVAADKQ